MTLVGLAGYAGSGKDALANFLVAEHGFQRIAFADKIREFTLAIDPVVAAFVKRLGWEGAKRHHPYVVRRTLQEVGVAARDIIGPDVWVDAALDDIEPEKRYVVTDVRFPNECGRIWDLAGTVYRVHRPGVGPVNAHGSETALDFIDLPMVSNGGTLEDLRRAAVSLVVDPKE